ncbi:MAG: galactose mutarotase [Clostridiales bacterium]|nr:galactose mutarotase [Clostridiales bacterium]
MKQRYDVVDGKDIFIYTIKRDKVEVDIVEMGARINAIRVDGVDVVLGYNSVNDYMVGGGYIGATVGRVANRIAGGVFTLGGKEYKLYTNNGKNHLHGGKVGFDKKIFVVTDCTDSSVTMEYVSPDGEENYPGTLKLTVKFTVEHNSLIIDFTAVSDKDTLWCPTNHAYFNLNGEQSGDCLTNLLQINADYYTPVDEGLIPTGEKRAVKNTPFDFNTPKNVGKDITDKSLAHTSGYDHNYVLSDEHAAHLEGPDTGIIMDLYTDMPCVQFYSAGKIVEINGKSGIYRKWAGFCLEPQYCPNAINMEGFEKPIIKKGEVKKHYIRYQFHKN